jgi:mRNA-degrading endonuclease RelE of RelBE toxin-antitoxin system
LFQIIFNEISAAEISRLDTMEQLDLLDQFKVKPEDLEKGEGGKFGRLERDGKRLYRFRSAEYRIYFAVEGQSVVVHRVLHKGTFQDFLFRSKLPLNEDEALSESKHFWELIEAGENARRL